MVSANLCIINKKITTIFDYYELKLAGDDSLILPDQYNENKFYNILFNENSQVTNIS